MLQVQFWIFVVLWMMTAGLEVEQFLLYSCLFKQLYNDLISPNIIGGIIKNKLRGTKSPQTLKK